MVMQVIKAFRYELKPNKKQEELLNKSVGCARFVYNWGLEQVENYYQETGKFLTAIDLHKRLVQLKQTEFNWMYEVSKCIPQQALRNVERAFKNFFKKKAKYPQFKKKGKDDSCYFGGSVKVGYNWVQLPRIGKVKLKETTEKFQGGIISATVRREADRWYVSIRVRTEIEEPVQPQGEPIGIDLGLDSFVTLSDGQKIEAPKPLKRYLKILKRRCKQHSRKKLGSKNRKKSAIRLARLYRKIRNIRLDFLHKLSTKLARAKPVIVVEGFKVQPLLKNRYLARSIADVSWHQFIQMLKYKTQWYGSRLIVLDQFQPTTRRCFNCKYVLVDELPLYKRKFKCPQCLYEEDRDINAAKNILELGIMKLSTASSAGINACGDCQSAVVEAGSNLLSINDNKL
jgi:putative transposase